MKAGEKLQGRSTRCIAWIVNLVACIDRHVAVKHVSLYLAYIIWLGGPLPYNGHGVCMELWYISLYRLSGGRLRLCTHTQPNDAKRHVGRNQPLPNACTCMLEIAAAVMSIASLECRFTSHVYIVLSLCGNLVWF